MAIENYSHILVPSMARNGGKLWSRLFDGHSQILSVPFEFRYSRKKGDWADIEYAVEHRNIEALLQEIDIRQFIELKQKWTAKPELFGLTFDLDYFQDHVRTKLVELPEWTMRSTVLTVLETFFESWDQGKQFLRSDIKQYFFNHRAMMFLADATRFFQEFDDGYVLHPVRDLRAFYSSYKRMRRIADNQFNVMEYISFLWLESALRSITNSRLFDRYILIRYEDLVVEKESYLKQICNRIGLSFEPILNVPTSGGKEWQGNSSFGARKGIETKSLDIWKKSLTTVEIDWLNKQFAEVMDTLGYADTGLSKIKNETSRVTIPFLKSTYRLNFENEMELLREQVRRFSNFTDFYYFEHMKEATEWSYRLYKDVRRKLQPRQKRE